MTVGVLLGGRLGYVLFYEPRHFLMNPLDIPAVWKGGMAFHGGLIGSIIAIVAFARRFKADAWSMLDACAAAAPIGLFFGRLANFINAELVGRPSTVPWAMVFPGAGPVERHPSQLYEAFFEGLVLFAVLWWLTHRLQVVAAARPAGRGISLGLWACPLVLRVVPRARPWPRADIGPVHRRHRLFPAHDRRRHLDLARGPKRTPATADAQRPG